MDKKIYLILLLTLNVSCLTIESTHKEGDKLKMGSTEKNETLNFTSGIRAIFQDRKGNYWFGSHSEGISYYDGKHFEYFTTNEGLQDNQIRSIQEDENGIIWIGTASGVSSFNGRNFTNYKTKIDSPRLEWNATTGNLWFYAGEENGINRFDGRNMNYLLFPKPEKQRRNNLYGVTDISKDNEGRVWIATYATLFRYDGEITNVFEAKNVNFQDNEQLHIRSVLADSKGRIWIGNNGIGVLLKEGDSILNFSEKQGILIPMNEFVMNTQKKQFSKNNGLQSVFAIEEDAEGNIWFGDRDTGAWKFDGKGMTNYIIDKRLKSKMIWSIYEDRNKNLLFGVADGKVYQFNGKTFDEWL